MFESVSSKVDFVRCVTKVDRSNFEQRCAIKSKIKYMLFFFFFFSKSQGIVYKESVPPDQTVNQTFYREVLERLRRWAGRERPGIARTWMLHLDTVPRHMAISINSFLAGKGIPVVPQPLIFAGSQFLVISFCVAAQGNYFQKDNLDS